MVRLLNDGSSKRLSPQEERRAARRIVRQGLNQLTTVRPEKIVTAEKKIAAGEQETKSIIAVTSRQIADDLLG